MFSNPSLEMRFRLGKAEIHWAVKYRLSDGQKLSKKNYPLEELYGRNYLTEERNYRKITTDQVVGVSYFCHLLLQNGSKDLEKKRIDKNFVKR